VHELLLSLEKMINFLCAEDKAVHKQTRAQHKRQWRQPKLNLQYKIVFAGLG